MPALKVKLKRAPPKRQVDAPTVSRKDSEHRDRLALRGRHVEHAEFLAAEARKQIAFAQAAFDDRHEVPQREIAARMSVCVVDTFEVIEIDDRKRGLAVGRRRGIRAARPHA